MTRSDHTWRPHIDAFKFSYLLVTSELAGEAEFFYGALLSTELEYGASVIELLPEFLIPGNCDAQRFFYVYVFACPHRVDSHRNMPVVGGGDHYCVDVIA